MPLINRIEVSNFMNSRREEPWRPDWAFQTFDLKGENTAINMPNGRGKSTIVHALLAMLAYDKGLNDLRQRHFAPQSTAHYSHVRIETYILADDYSPMDLVVQAGGDVGGYPMVFGVYGNSGESGSHRLYSYRGTLEDCPIGRKEGNRVTLTNNSVFLEKLTVMPGRFPAAQRDETRVNWRDYVAGIFDMPSIEQQLVYQKAKGAEGSSGYFDVNSPRGRPFSEAVFYERLAPELLVDMMGGVEEYADERGIEDTIYLKVQGIIKAKVQTAKTARDLEKTRQVLDELQRVKEKADAVVDAKLEVDTKLEMFSLEYAVLKTLVVDDPVPGIPRMPPDDAPRLARSMVMQRGKWFLPDRAFELLTGEKPSPINQRAIRHNIATDTVENSQVIDFDCDQKKRDDRGRQNQLYNFISARSLLENTTTYLAPYDRDMAIQAVEDAFRWANEYADTNPARREQKDLKAKNKVITDSRDELHALHSALQNERDNLKDEQQRIGAQQDEYRRMAESELFSESELASPAETGLKVQEEFKIAEYALTSHRSRVSEHKTVFGEWQQFVTENGEETNPLELADRLAQAKKDAQIALNSNKSDLDEANRVLNKAVKDAEGKDKIVKALSEKSEKIATLRPLVLAFRERFGDENPEGLVSKVKDELYDAQRRLEVIATEHARMADALKSLKIFKEAHEDDTDPKVWLDARSAERDALSSFMAKLQEHLDDLIARRADLDKAVVAPGKVAREVLQLAGDDAEPLHAAIEAMALPLDRKERVLSLFSALLFSPVYSDVARAAAVAVDLAAQGVESPVFVFSELTEFCHNVDINYNGAIANTWLVGVRTRPVDCLLDPVLVEREKNLLEAEIKAMQENFSQKKSQFNALDPESDEAIIARKAREAIEKGFLAKDAAFREEHSDLNDKLPLLIDRASEEALESIRAIIDYRKILAGASEDALSEDFAKAEESATLASEYCEQCNENVDKLINARENLHTAFQVASVNAEHIPKMKRISAFIDGDGPAFMQSASATETKLANSKTRADARKTFRFELADAFVKSGDRRPLEIEQRLNEIVPEMKAILEERIPELQQQLIVINDRLPQLEALVLEIDTFITELLKKFRVMTSTDFEAQIVPTEHLLSHPLTEAAIDVRRAYSLQSITNALPLLREPLYNIEASSLKNDVDSAKKAWDVARSQFSGEIDRVKGDTNLALNEQMRIGLEQAKDDLVELRRLIDGTQHNYDKSLVANEAARKILDDQWGEIGTWLENFTRRLPTNFDAMRSVFRPARDSASGEIISAGFEIEARIADMNDVRSVLTGIVEKIEKSEKSREALVDDEKLRTSYERNMRKEIREEFYRNVIIDPKIRVCIPSISRKALLLEKNMGSSGQGVAMTLLWIVKMADYVTERELRRQNVSNAQRNRVRSMRTQFVIIDGAFSHLSDKRLINDALQSVKNTRGKFQLIITGHDPNYKNDYAYFPTYIAAREIGGNLMYADSETRRLVAPEEVGSRNGVMELASWHKVHETSV